MKIKINIHTEHEVVDTFDEETEEVNSHNQVFKPGEIWEVDVYEDYVETVDIQFSDGSMAYHFPKESYTELNPAFVPALPVRTYRELGAAIAQMNDEQLDSTITVEDPAEEECYPAELRIAGDNHDSLDDNHPVIYIPL